jgi:hypothetical protein
MPLARFGPGALLALAVAAALSLARSPMSRLSAGPVSAPVVTATFDQLTQGSLRLLQADGPGTALPSGTNWLASFWDYTSRGRDGGIRHALFSGTLDAPYSGVVWSKESCVRNASGYCVDSAAGAATFTSFAPGVDNVVELWFVDLYWPAPGVTREVLAFIHEERPGHQDRTQLGLAWSSDGGETWRYLGRIIRPHRDRAGGNITGAPYLVRDGDFYVYYTDAMTPEYVRIGVSRAPVNQVIAAARAGDVGKDLWHKYYNGGWTEPSLGGRASFPTEQWGVPHTQTIHSRVTGEYYMPLYFQAWPAGAFRTLNTTVKLYRSADGLTWRLAATLADEPASEQGPWGGYAYCSATDPRGTPNHEAADTFYVYCLKFKNGQQPGHEYAQYRWTVHLDPEDAPARTDPNARLSTSW